MNHSIAALNPKELVQDPRVMIGSPDCKQPYSAAIYNVSAMSFGSLSSAAIEALNGGAKIGHFAHNTGEGGISPYHLRQGGDLIYQIGTGYLVAVPRMEIFTQKNLKNVVKMKVSK